MHIYIHITMITEKRETEFERRQEEVVEQRKGREMM